MSADGVNGSGDIETETHIEDLLADMSAVRLRCCCSTPILNQSTSWMRSAHKRKPNPSHDFGIWDKFG